MSPSEHGGDGGEQGAGGVSEKREGRRTCGEMMRPERRWKTKKRARSIHTFVFPSRAHATRRTTPQLLSLHVDTRPCRRTGRWRRCRLRPAWRGGVPARRGRGCTRADGLSDPPSATVRGGRAHGGTSSRMGPQPGLSPVGSQPRRARRWPHAAVRAEEPLRAAAGLFAGTPERGQRGGGAAHDGHLRR